MDLRVDNKYFKLVLFTLFTGILAYGFTLTNYSLTIDSETPINSDFSMSLGRWGTNLVRYHIFQGHLLYFTLLLGLFFLSLAAAELTRFFKLNGTLAYLFCALFISFPQLSYQLVFTMQADVVPLGFFCAALALNLFVKTEQVFTPKSILYFALSALLLMFVVAIYQALVFIPIVCYIIYFFQSTFRDYFSIKTEFKRALHFGLLMVVALLLYYISVKILCPPVEGGYLSSYVSGDSSNRFSNFYTLWVTNLKGRAYYGERLFMIAFVLSIVLVIRFAVKWKLFAYRLLSLLLIVLLPFLISFFITNNYNPPRIYVTSGIVFAFIIVHTVRNMKADKIVITVCSLICITNIYYITQLFYSNYRIFNHDKNVAIKIEERIRSTYPDFDENVNYVYFWGYFPYQYHDRYRLPDSEIFGGSFFNWDNGSNDRIINFIKYNDIAYYRMVDNKEALLKVKDSIPSMPEWPKSGSVKLINNVMVVKLGKDKGAPLWVE